MSKDKIPVYDICSLSGDRLFEEDLLAERFASYIKRHSPGLHLPHRHKFYHFVLFTKGSGSHTIDFTQFKVKPFDIYFMIPGQVHSWQFDGPTDGYIVNFSENIFRSFLLNPNYLERFVFFDGLSADGVCSIPSAARAQVTGLLEEIIGQTSLETGLDMIRLLLLQVFMIVDQSANKKYKTIPQSKQTLLRNFRKLIDQHFISIKLPKQYAELLYVTPNHLNSLCQDMAGKTAGEMIRDRVILEAKRLLTNADLTITEIAFKLNFQDNSYFNRFFKKYTAHTPDEFRKQLIIPKK